MLRTDDRTWWLDGLADPVPASGSEVTVTGTATAATDTLHVDELTVTGAGTATIGGVAAAPPSTRVLAVRVSSGVRGPRRTRRRPRPSSG